MSQPDNSNSAQDYYDLVRHLRRDLQLDLSTDVQPNTRLVLPAYTAPTLTANWTNFGTGLEVASFYIDNVSVVHLGGTLSGGAGVLNGETIFTLPAGYRPRARKVFAVTDTGAGVIRVDVTTAGLVLYLGAAGAHTLSLDAISFRADQ